jgi:hypothetical protein
VRAGESRSAEEQQLIGLNIGQRVQYVTDEVIPPYLIVIDAELGRDVSEFVRIKHAGLGR